MKQNQTRAIFVALVLLLFARPAVTQMATREDLIEKEFQAWARRSLDPLSTVAHPFATTVSGAELEYLKPLGNMIGNATVVSFGEGMHGGAQPLEFRNLLFRYLVEKLGFTTIAIESGITESDGVNQYVSGGPGDLNKVVDQGFSWTFNAYPQEASLVQWMRDYNADPHHFRKIQFYGFDMPGSPTNPDAGVACGRGGTMRCNIWIVLIRKLPRSYGIGPLPFFPCWISIRHRMRPTNIQRSHKQTETG